MITVSEPYVPKLRELRAQGKLPPTLMEALARWEAEQEDKGKKIAVGRRGITVAALYYLGASYGQLSGLFHISRPTLVVHIQKHLGKLKPDRTGTRKALLPWETIELYKNIAEMETERDPIRLAAIINAKAQEMMDEDDIDILDPPRSETTDVREG